MDANRADRLAQTKFGDGYILPYGVYFVTGRYTCFLAKRYHVLQPCIQLVKGKTLGFELNFFGSKFKPCTTPSLRSRIHLHVGLCNIRFLQALEFNQGETRMSGLKCLIAYPP